MQFEERGETQKDSIMKLIDWQGKKESETELSVLIAIIISIIDQIKNMVLQNINHKPHFKYMSQSFFLRKRVYCFCSYQDLSRCFPKWDYSGKQYILEILLQVFPLLIISPLSQKTPHHSEIIPLELSWRLFVFGFFCIINVTEGQMYARPDPYKSTDARNWSLEQELCPQISQ